MIDEDYLRFKFWRLAKIKRRAIALGLAQW
jgi:hypothetical protein